MIEAMPPKMADWAMPIMSGSYSAEPLTLEDFASIRIWRNAQIDILRQDRPLSEADQQRYYSSQVRDTYGLDQPVMMLFGLKKEGRLIAYGGLVHIDWTAGRAELSFLHENTFAQAPESYAEDFSVFISMMKHLTFEITGLNRLTAEVYDIRPEHIKIMEENGFILEGRLREHVKIRGRYVDSLIHSILKSDINDFA